MDYIRYIGSKLSISIKGVSLVGYNRYIGWNPGVSTISISPLMDYIRYIGSKLSIIIKGVSSLVGYIRYISLNPGVGAKGISPI